MIISTDNLDISIVLSINNSTTKYRRTYQSNSYTDQQAFLIIIYNTRSFNLIYNDSMVKGSTQRNDLISIYLHPLFTNIFSVIILKCNLTKIILIPIPLPLNNRPISLFINLSNNKIPTLNQTLLIYLSCLPENQEVLQYKQECIPNKYVPYTNQDLICYPEPKISNRF